MRDPGYISEAAWNQEAPYRDADHYERLVGDIIDDGDEDRSVLEPRSEWLHRQISERLKQDRLLPTVRNPHGAVLDVADRDVTSPPVAAGLLPGGDHPS